MCEWSRVKGSGVEIQASAHLSEEALEVNVERAGLEGMHLLLLQVRAHLVRTVCGYRFRV